MDSDFGKNILNFQAAINLLPYDGEAFYFPQIFTVDEAAAHVLTLLSNIQWQHDELMIYGKKIITKRQVAWYGDEGLSYTYSNRTKLALPWNPKLLSIKAKVEEACSQTYNSCLLNLYANGKEGMAWHSDNEKELDPNGSIASVSLGAERVFQFKHKTSKELISCILEPGSLLLMKQNAQAHWQHRLPERAAVKEQRINLTFRKIIQQYQ